MAEPTSRHRVAAFLALAAAAACIGTGCAEKPRDASVDKTSRTLEDVIPLTAANMRGHRMLYNEGWFVITSSRQALEYAKVKSIVSSGQAIREAQQRVRSHSSEYRENLKTALQHSRDAGKEGVRAGTEISGRILQGTGALAHFELTIARSSAQAWETFVQGYLTLAQRTKDDREELAGLPGGWFNGLQRDFSNVWQVTRLLHEQFAGKIEVSWNDAFAQAGHAFREEYDRSGEQGNTLMALGPILQGYLKAMYHGAAVPAAKTLVRAGASGTAHAAGAVFLPIADTSVVAGRTIQSVGLTVFYTSKTGVKLISPTLESGLLSGMAVLSLAAIPLTYVTSLQN